MAGYTVDELFAKLERADAAGDTEAASVIADEIRRVQMQPAKAAKPDFSNVTRGSSTADAVKQTGDFSRAKPYAGPLLSSGTSHNVPLATPVQLAAAQQEMARQRARTPEQVKQEAFRNAPLPMRVLAGVGKVAVGDTVAGIGQRLGDLSGKDDVSLSDLITGKQPQPRFGFNQA